MHKVQSDSRVAKHASIPRSTSERVFGTMFSTFSDAPSPNKAVTIDRFDKLDTGNRPA